MIATLGAMMLEMTGQNVSLAVPAAQEPKTVLPAMKCEYIQSAR